jgi:hypothetical protein
MYSPNPFVGGDCSPGFLSPVRHVHDHRDEPIPSAPGHNLNTSSLGKFAPCGSKTISVCRFAHALTSFCTSHPPCLCPPISNNSTSSARCLPLPFRPLCIFNFISYLNRFHLVFRISEDLIAPVGCVCALGGGLGSGVVEALLAHSKVSSSAAVMSMAMELVATNDMKREAKALWRLVMGVVFVLISGVRFAVAVLDFDLPLEADVRGLKVTFDFADVLRLWFGFALAVVCCRENEAPQVFDEADVLLPSAPESAPSVNARSMMNKCGGELDWQVRSAINKGRLKRRVPGPLVGMVALRACDSRNGLCVQSKNRQIGGET